MCESAKQERDTLIFMRVLTWSTDLVVTDYNAPLASLACTVIRHCSSWLPKPARRCQFLLVTGVVFLRHLYMSGDWRELFFLVIFTFLVIGVTFLRHLPISDDFELFP